jgi:hypothetical protein
MKEPIKSESEPRNVAGTVIVNRCSIGVTDYGMGALPIPLTMTEAKALESLGLITITGLFI